MKKYSFLICLIYMLYSCGDNPFKCDKYYEFKLPIQTSLLKDSFSIGDTIWFESKFSNNLAIEGENDSLILENFNFRSTIKIKELVCDTFYLYENPYAEHKFNIFQEIEGVKSEFKIEKIEFIKYHYKNNQYFSKIYLVPKSKGFFYVSFSNILETNAHRQPRTEITNENNCNQYYLGVKFYINGGKNNSGHLLKGKYRFNTKVPRTDEDLWGSEYQAVAFYVR